MINIHDPVADKTYMLDPAARTAREIRPFRMAFAHAQGFATRDGESRRANTVHSANAEPPATSGARAAAARRRCGERHRGPAQPTAARTCRCSRAGAVVAMPPDSAKGRVGAYEPGEDLGEQVLEGLLVQGTRMTDTIPAGTMGNERPIEIVTERWYSKDIDAMVLQRFFDPRFGETIYRLVNVVRGEPSPDLFQVPQGYEIDRADGPRRADGSAGRRASASSSSCSASRHAGAAVTRAVRRSAALPGLDRDEPVDDEPLARRRPSPVATRCPSTVVSATLPRGFMRRCCRRSSPIRARVARPAASAPSSTP